jgi:hypothetical protein
MFEGAEIMHWEGLLLRPRMEAITAVMWDRLVCGDLSSQTQPTSLNCNNTSVICDVGLSRTSRD